MGRRVPHGRRPCTGTVHDPPPPTAPVPTLLRLAAATAALHCAPGGLTVVNTGALAPSRRSAHDVATYICHALFERTTWGDAPAILAAFRDAADQHLNVEPLVSTLLTAAVDIVPPLNRARALTRQPAIGASALLALLLTVAYRPDPTGHDNTWLPLLGAQSQAGGGQRGRGPRFCSTRSARTHGRTCTQTSNPPRRTPPRGNCRGGLRAAQRGRQTRYGNL